MQKHTHTYQHLHPTHSSHYPQVSARGNKDHLLTHTFNRLYTDNTTHAGISQGNKDRYFLSPDGKVVRTRAEAERRAWQVRIEWLFGL